MSGIYDVTIAAGASAYVGATGSYVKVLAAIQGPVQVKLDGGEGYSLQEGQGFRLPDGAAWFRDVQVRNLAASTQTVSLFIGDSRFEDSRITGDVRIVDSISSACRTDLYAPSLAVQAFTATALLSPAANTNGVLIRATRIAAKCGASGTVAVYLFASPISPTSSGGAQLMTLGVVADTAGTSEVQSGQFDLKKRIPIGWGIYGAIAVTTTTAATGGATICTETL